MLKQHLSFRGQPEREQKHHCFSLRVRRKKLGDGVVEKREPRRPQALCIAGQVHPSPKDAALQLRRPIAAIAMARRHVIERYQNVDVHARITREILLEIEVSRLVSELPTLEGKSCRSRSRKI